MTSDKTTVILIGAPRSGTSFSFDMFATHPEVAIATNHDDLVARTPLFGLFGATYAGPFGRFKFAAHRWETGLARLTHLAPRTTEMFRFWNWAAGERFLYGYLWDVEAAPGEARRVRTKLLRLARLQRRSHLVIKLTGPGRIRYLKSIFADAFFIHITRRPEAQVASLLKAAFWKDGGGPERIWWRKDIPSEWQDFLARAEKTGSPVAIAAAQWASVVRSIQTEAAAVLAPERYIEVGYPELVGDPAGTMARLWQAVGLHAGPDITARLSEFDVRQDNDEKWKTSFSDDELTLLRDWSNPALDALPNP